jgi:hypothetical protein
MANVYEVCGTYEAVTGPAIFPIDIIEADDPAQALEIVAQKSARLRPWNRLLKLYRVPFFKTDLKPWRDDEIELASSPPWQKPKERTLSGPAETPSNRATSSRNGGRNHLGTPSDIKSEWRARSSRNPGRLPSESVFMPAGADARPVGEHPS